MNNYKEHIIHKDTAARAALKILDDLGGFVSRTLFVIDEDGKMVGSLTDGDIRRGLLNGNEISHPVSHFMNEQFKFIFESNDNVELIKNYRKAHIELLPLLDKENESCKYSI